MMERREFDELVESVERRFEGRPDALMRHTWRWLLLGYTVVICLTALLIGGGIAIFVAGIVLPGAWVLLVLVGGALITLGLAQFGALTFVQLQEPRGRVLSPEEAPELRKLLKLLCTEIGSPVPDAIVLTDDFNAAIMQHPRLGIFGWSRSVLILGTPLLMATTPQETAAVLAHECGHLSMKHGRQGNRIYGMHQSWEKLFQKLQQNVSSRYLRLARSLVVKFIDWYWPRFHARAFIVSRHNEFAADRRSVEATNAEYAASALWRIDCVGYMLENEFWKGVWDEAAELSEPPDDLCERFRDALVDAPSSANADRWCDYALQRVANNEDSHPSLRDRLSAIGVPPEALRERGFPASPELSAFESLLGNEAESIEYDINQFWRTNVLSIWRDRHRRIGLIKKQSDDITDEKEDLRTPEEIWNDTRSLLDAQGLEAAEPALRRLLTERPDHVGGMFALGQLRLIQGHEDGESLLRHVVELKNAEWTPAAGNVLERHLLTTGRKEDVRELRKALDDFEKERMEAELERRQLKRSDTFLPHQLSHDQLEQVTRLLDRQEACHTAWLARKELVNFPEEKLFVLSVDVGKRVPKRRDRNDRLVASLTLLTDLPGRVFVVTPTGEFRKIAKQLMKQDGFRIFDRSLVAQAHESTV